MLSARHRRKAQGVLVQILAADTNDTPVQMSRSCRRCTDIWYHRQCVVSMSARLSNGLSVTADIQSVMVLLRAVSLWDNRNSIRYALIGGFVVCLGVSFAFTVSSALRSIGKYQRLNIVCLERMTRGIGVIGAMSYSPEINACVINENAYHGRITGYMVGAWGGMVRSPILSADVHSKLTRLSILSFCTTPMFSS